MHSEQIDLAKRVWTVSSSGVREHTGSTDTLVRNETIGVVRLDNGRAHEDVQDQSGSRESDPQVGERRFDFEQERSPVGDRIAEACRKAALEEAKKIDRWLETECPICCTKHADNGEVIVRYETDGTQIFSCASCFRRETMPQWKRDFLDDYFKPIPADTWDYLDHPG